MVARLIRGVHHDADRDLIGSRAEGCGMVLVGQQRPVAHGPVAVKRPTSNLKIAVSGQAVGSHRRIRAAPSTTRAAILISRNRSVVNSAVLQAECFGAAERRVWSSQ